MKYLIVLPVYIESIIVTLLTLKRRKQKSGPMKIMMIGVIITHWRAMRCDEGGSFDQDDVQHIVESEIGEIESYVSQMREWMALQDY